MSEREMFEGRRKAAPPLRREAPRFALLSGTSNRNIRSPMTIWGRIMEAPIMSGTLQRSLPTAGIPMAVEAEGNGEGKVERYEGLDRRGL